jgi:hypothetical protein
VAPEKELVENVHGVRGTFLDVGKELCGRIQSGAVQSDPVFSADAEPKVYFIGKLLWSKGLGSLMELLKYADESASLRVAVDMYGGGPDMNAAEKKAEKLGLDMPFHGPLDHAELSSTHKVRTDEYIFDCRGIESLALPILILDPFSDFCQSFYIGSSVYDYSRGSRHGKVRHYPVAPFQ